MIPNFRFGKRDFEGAIASDNRRQVDKNLARYFSNKNPPKSLVPKDSPIMKRSDDFLRFGKKSLDNDDDVYRAYLEDLLTMRGKKSNDFLRFGRRR